MNKCRICGGIANPSKALMNIHNRKASYLKGEKEFYTKLVPCVKCEKCGHSWVN